MNAATRTPATPSKYVPPALLVDGEWIEASARETQPVVNPATGRAIGVVPHATAAGFSAWNFPIGNAAREAAIEAGMVGIEAFLVTKTLSVTV